MKTVLFIFFAVSGLQAFSQPVNLSYSNATLNKEQIYVQLNSTFLITGETLYFNVFCRAGEGTKPSFMSKVAYLELMDAMGAPVFQTKILLHEGRGYGEFFIPSTFVTGNYTLIAYTRWMRNFASNSFFANRVTIANPFRGPAEPATGGEKSVRIETANLQPPSKDLRLSLEGKTFGSRMKVSVSLTSTEVASVCVSVRKKDSLLHDSGTMLKRLIAIDTLQQNEAPTHFSSSGFTAPTQEGAYTPEMRGHLISGTLVPKAGEDKAVTLLATIPGSDFLLRTVKTDQDGKFVMIVDRIPESSAMVFQIMDGDISQYELNVDGPFLEDYTGFLPAPLSVDSGAWSIVDKRNVYMQIENAYYEVKQDTFTQEPAPAHFYSRPDKTYRLDDFTRFPTLEDVFREYVPEVVLKNLRGTYSLQVVNPDSGFPYQKEPLMLIDGVPMPSANLFLANDPLKIERMELVTDRYLFGSLEFQGIISLFTYKGAIQDLPKFNSHREDLVGMQSERVPYFPDYSTNKAELERIPDFRLQLYWDPNVKLLADQTATLEFYTSDIPGEYEVLVEGFSNSGSVVTARKVFFVE